MDDLAARLLDLASDSEPLLLTYGIVTQASPLLVQVGAATSGLACKKSANYTPVVADFVAVLQQGADRLVLFKVN